MRTEQFVMAYSVDHDRLRAVLPEGFVSIRPVLRINAEIRDNKNGYMEFNTAVEKDGNKGWLNIDYWYDVPYERNGKTTVFRTDFLELSFTDTGIEGSCPAEKDNTGCYFIKNKEELRPPEIITSNKVFCDCSFRWKYSRIDAYGESIGKTLPAIPSEIRNVYPRKDFSVKNIVQIACEQVLGAYVVRFIR